jgi:hypothetical protein
VSDVLRAMGVVGSAVGSPRAEEALLLLVSCACCCVLVEELVVVLVGVLVGERDPLSASSGTSVMGPDAGRLPMFINPGGEVSEVSEESEVGEECAESAKK